MPGLRDRANLVLRSLFGNIENTVGPLGMLSGITQGRGEPPRRGTVDFLRLYNENPNIRGVTHKIGYSTASVEWRVSVQRKRGKVVRAKHVQRCRNYKERSRMVRQLRKDGELEELLDHPLLDTLYRPNPVLNGLEVRQLTQVWLDLVGEAFWITRRNEFGMPIEFWPVPPTWVVTFPTTDHPFFELRFRSWHGMVPESEMVCFRYPDPLNPYGRGSGTAMSLRDEVDVDEYAAKHKRQWFYNRARPDLIIMPAGEEHGSVSLTKEEMKPVEERWMERSQGFWNAFKPLFLTKKVDVKELSQTFENMQMVELRQFEKAVIRQNFGVPPEILGQTEDSNRATMETADFIMAKYVATPRLEYQREVIQEDVAPLYDENLIVEYVSPIEEDHDRKLKAMEAAPWVPDSEEWREVMGLDPAEDEKGRLHAVPIGITLVSDLQEYAETSARPALPMFPDPEEGDGEDEDLDGDALLELDEDDPDGAEERLAASARPQRKRIVSPSIVKVTPGQKSHLACKTIDDEEFYGIVHRIADRLQPVMVQRMLAAFRAVEASIDVDKFAAIMATGSATQALNSLPWLELAQHLGAIDTQIIRAAFQLSGEQSAAEFADVLGFQLRFDLEHPTAADWARRNAAQLIKEVTNETKAAVRELIAAAIENEWTRREVSQMIAGKDGKPGMVGLLRRDVERLNRRRLELEAAGIPADRIRERIARAARQMVKRRARVIARTELMNSTNAGQQILWEQAVARGELDWQRTTKIVVVTPDDRLDFKVCEPMPDMKENKDLRITDKFTTGTGERFLAPTFHPQCRCGMRIEVAA